MKLYLEKISKTPKPNFVVYTGGFNPWHNGHKAVYDEVAEKFGKDNVYVLTTDPEHKKKKNERDIFSFDQKRRMIVGSGVPAHRVIELFGSGYRWEDFQKSIFKLDTQRPLIVVVGEDDAARLTYGKYFKEYDDILTLKPMTEEGYFYVIKNKNREEFKASKIRELIAQKKFKSLQSLVPPSTIDVIKGM